MLVCTKEIGEHSIVNVAGRYNVVSLFEISIWKLWEHHKCVETCKSGNGSSSQQNFSNLTVTNNVGCH